MAEAQAAPPKAAPPQAAPPQAAPSKAVEPGAAACSPSEYAQAVRCIMTTARLFVSNELSGQSSASLLRLERFLLFRCWILFY